MSTRVLILGATSSIAQATSRLLAERGARLVLVARAPDRLDLVARDLHSRGAADVKQIAADLADLDGLEHVLAEAWNQYDGLDIAIVAHGTLDAQQTLDEDPQRLQQALATNALSPILCLRALADRMRRTTTPAQLVAVSSVAGDRGRASNFGYGAAKAALTTYADGLRGALHETSVNVLTVKPGVVDTPMTAGSDFPLKATPERVARDVVNALDKRQGTLYTPWFWRPIMFAIRHLPDFVMKRLRF